MRDSSIVKDVAIRPIASLLVERPGADLSVELEALGATHAGLVFQKEKQRATDALAASVVDHRHALDLGQTGRLEDDAARAARNSVQERERMDRVGLIALVDFLAGPNALLFDEDRPAQPQAVVDFVGRAGEAHLDRCSALSRSARRRQSLLLRHAGFFSPKSRSVATAQSTAARPRNSKMETRSLLAKPGMRALTLTASSQALDVSDSCRNASSVPKTEAPAMRPKEKSTPGPLSASASESFLREVLSAM